MENKTLKIKGTVYAGYRYSICNNTNAGLDPFVELNCTKDTLDITGGFYGRYLFLKDDIISIDPYDSWLPIFRNGIKINHKIKNYFPFIIFKSRGESYDSLIKKIKETGFWDNNSCTLNTEEIVKIKEIQKNKRYLYQWYFILAWYLLFFIFIFIRKLILSY